MTSSTRYTMLDSPVGKLLLAANPSGLSGLWITGEKHCPAIPADWQEDADGFEDAASQLAGYFAGTRRVFTLPLAPAGTDFQQQAWAALQQIPYGQTRSYRQQATALGRPAAVRATGTANGKNPISILIPCHRVIGANGALTGYGGGLDAKAWLLAHEAKHAGPEQTGQDFRIIPAFQQ
jgi:methylated-DNA-[protein]-cysteine S-methyltransferase